MPTVLVVEDQPNLLRSLTQAISEAGFEVLAAPTLQIAGRLYSNHVDLIVLDLMLPDGNGLDWMQSLRDAKHTVPVLVLTARDTIQDRVRGLDGGADDYLVKPFSIDELLARLRALLRRDERLTAFRRSVGDLTIDLVTREVRRGDTIIELQPRQFELLAFLAEHRHEIVTRQMIADKVWKQSDAMWTNVIEVHINQLRRKLECADRPVLLNTVRGKGYRLGDARG